jgi:hypothetical protein
MAPYRGPHLEHVGPYPEYRGPYRGYGRPYGKYGLTDGLCLKTRARRLFVGQAVDYSGRQRAFV